MRNTELRPVRNTGDSGRSPASEEEMSEMSVRRLLPPRYTDAQIEAWRDRHADLGDRYEEAALAELLALRAENKRLRRRESLLRLPPTWLLKAAELHCEWLAFKHALNAAINAIDERDALSGETAETKK